jgi:hypothetical protein
MTPLFDIFQAETGGSAHWLESAATLEDTKERDQQFAGAFARRVRPFEPRSWK